VAIDKFVKPSSEFSAGYSLEAGANSGDELLLPDAEAEGFVSLPPLLTIEEMTGRSRQLREWYPAGVPTTQERWEARVREPFEL
jgi:hypothetical protein